VNDTVPTAPRPPSRIPWREILIALLLCVGTDLLFFHGRTHLVFPDAMEYAQIARSLAEGNGYRTRTLWLSRLSLEHANPDEWAERGAPDVRRPPLHVIVTAGAFRLFGASDRVATTVSAVFATLTAFLLFLALRRLFPPPAAWLGLILMLLDPGRIFYGPTGLSEPLFTVLLLLFALVLIREGRPHDDSAPALIRGNRHRDDAPQIGRPRDPGLTGEPPSNHVRFASGGATSPGRLSAGRPTGHGGLAGPARPWVLLGVLLGLMAWTRHNAFLLLPAAAVAIILVRRPIPWKHLGLFAAVFIPFLVVPAVRNGLVAGVWDPVGMPRWVAANDVGGAPKHLAERSMDPPPTLGELLTTRPGPLFVKVRGNMKRNSAAAVSAFSPFLWILVALGIWLAWRDPRLRILLFFSAFTTFILILAFSLGEFEGPRFFSPLTPLWITVSAFGLRRWVGDVGPKLVGGAVPAWVMTGFVVVGILYPGWEVAGVGQRRPEALGRRFEFLQDGKYDGAAFLADVPWFVGWYGGRTAYWLPFSPREAEEAETRAGSAYILLTPASGQYRELAGSWGPVLVDRRIPGYGTPDLPRGDGLVFLFPRED
jgi:hypothetical protein